MSSTKKPELATVERDEQQESISKSELVTEEMLDADEAEFAKLRRDLPGVKGASVAGIVTVTVTRNPVKNEFFRTHPDFHPEVLLVQHEEGMEKEFYAVDTDMEVPLKGIGIDCIKHRLYMIVTPRGGVRIIPISCETDNEWVRTKEIGLLDGTKQWVRIYSDRENSLSAFYVVLLIEIAVAALFATAFNLLMGFGGMVSFGHAAYFALGAYAAALLAQKAGWPMLAAFAAAPLVAAFGAFVFGFFIVRLTHTYFAMLSLAFAQILYTIIFKWTSLTGGDNGLLNVWPPAFLRSVTAYYYFTLLVIGACFLALHSIVNSPFGYALKAIRENPRRARFIGVNVRRHQLYAFVLSGFFSGVAGAVFTFHNGSVFPDFAFFTKSFEPLVIVLLGGMQSFYGPLAGAFGFKLMEWLISRWAPIYWPLFLGAILIAVIVALPQGFVGFFERRAWRLRANGKK